MKEALFYQKLEDKKVQCQLCPRRCSLAPNKTGVCDVRQNLDGKLYSQNYGKLRSISIDPIEKKPLFHFLPGTQALSICTSGCNLKCKFCQNHPLSQAEGKIFGREMEPKKIVEIAKRENTKTIAYTYTEPTVFYEYALDIMKLAKKAGLKNIWVSNGYINDAPIRKMAPFLDAINLDIKGNEEAYCNLCHGSLKPVLKSAKEFKKHGVWIEITCLIIPGHNDDPDWMETLSKWIFENLGTSCPLHLSRFSPAHEMQDADPTPLETLTQLHKIAKKHLNYVYIGNIPTETYANTICPKCGEELIIRSNYHSKILGTTCKRCGKKLEGVFE